ncbi:LCP family protein [Deinococcus petrolearius]|uniref:LCP family protein n=1 Tax=Deinococcus petrolearius TaxID=1751295 RepID=A0ABW1DL43_9DEIO
MRRRIVMFVLVLAGLAALIAPAVPALSRYAALPRKGEAPLNLVLAGLDVDYDWSAPTWPYPAKPQTYTTRTDTLMLAQFRPGGEVRLLSIPRDTWMNVPGSGWGKINGANVHGGPELVKAAVQSLTGVPVDGYVYLSLGAVRQLTDAAGGVTVDVDRVMKYDDRAGNLHIDLQPGRQRLNGEQMEGYLRFRKDAAGDIGRVTRQQQFLSALTGKLKSPLNWWRLPGMVGTVYGNVKTDLTRAQVGELLGAVSGGLNIQAASVPGGYGDSTWIPDRAALNTLVSREFRDPGDPRGLRVGVANIAAPDGSARRLVERLQAAGYQNVTLLDEPRRALGVTTVAGTGAARLLRDVGHGGVAGDSAQGLDVTVRLGSDTPAE